jgi:maltose alpha-D-glucosyltransferase/alpha-amylase
MALDQHRQSYDTVADRAVARAVQWRDETTRGFVAAYREHVEGAATMPEQEALTAALLDLFLLQKGIYEIVYELGNRPAWLRIPLRGVLDVVSREPG